jgi:hypothetical protein
MNTAFEREQSSSRATLYRLTGPERPSFLVSEGLGVYTTASLTLYANIDPGKED